jgi:hypothetical protein
MNAIIVNTKKMYCDCNFLNFLPIVIAGVSNIAIAESIAKKNTVKKKIMANNGHTNDQNVENIAGSVTNINPGQPLATSLTHTHCDAAMYHSDENTAIADRNDTKVFHNTT